MTITTRIALLSSLPVGLCTAILVSLSLGQRQELSQSLRQTIDTEAISVATRMIDSIHDQFAHANERSIERLGYSFEVARERLGTVDLGDKAVEWQARNQNSGETVTVQLPEFRVNGQWLGQNTSPATPSPTVDELRRVRQDHMTVFQRMNEAGDMLRVCTTVVGTNGQRAIGTFIPAKLADGTANPVISQVTRGTNFIGRAKVLQEWFHTRYEPIWDSSHQKVIGMLFVGTSLASSNEELRERLMRTTIGKSGYPFIIAASGADRGKYILSKDGQRDGENLWEAKDASGRLFIQDLITRSMAAPSGQPITIQYEWKNPGEQEARVKYAAATYFAPYDWVLAVGAYQDEHHDTVAPVLASITRTVRWSIGLACGLGTTALILGIVMARSLTRPLLRTIHDLKSNADGLTTAATAIRDASQTIADGASSQASSLEEASASLEEMSAMTRRSADNAEGSKVLSEKTHQAASSGLTHLEEMHQTLGGIRTAVGEMETAVGEIHQSAREVAKIIQTIDGIAFQTNLLALNAAVEAARAGEAGAGFAVVADEVRALAQRSAQAARDTADKIENSLRSSERGSETSAAVVKNLNEVEATAKRLQAGFTGIVQNVRDLNDSMGGVVSAAREQNQGIEQINIAVGQVDRVTQANAAAAEENASASAELNGQARALHRSVDELRAVIDGRRLKEAAGTASESSREPAAAPTSKPALASAKHRVIRGPVRTVKPGAPVPANDAADEFTL